MGIADPASEPGRPGLVDQSQFARANQAIQMACQNLINPASTQQQVSMIELSLPKVIVPPKIFLEASSKNRLNPAPPSHHLKHTTFSHTLLGLAIYETSYVIFVPEFFYLKKKSTQLKLIHALLKDLH